MKNIKLILAFAMIAVMVALAAAAAPVGKVYISDESADGVAISFNAQYTDAVVQSIYAKVTFDNTILVPCEEEDYTSTVANDEVDSFVIPYWESKKVFFSLVDNALTSVTEGTKTTIEFNAFTQTVKDSEDLDLVTMWFAFADGKSKDDLVTGTFTVDAIYFGDSDKVNWANNYDEVPNPQPFTFTNEVVTEAGDEVILPINESGVDLRVSGNEATSGIRFKADFQTAYRVEGNELGYIASVDKEKNYTDGALVLDFAAVDAGKAAKGIAYGDGKDIFWNVDGETTVITVALLGTPMTKEALQTGVAVRAYQIIGGTTYYANDAMTSTPYDTAKAIKAAGGEAYTKNQEYVDKIIDTVEGTADPTSIVLDISSLFE